VSKVVIYQSFTLFSDWKINFTRCWNIYSFSYVLSKEHLDHTPKFPGLKFFRNRGTINKLHQISLALSKRITFSRSMGVVKSLVQFKSNHFSTRGLCRSIDLKNCSTLQKISKFLGYIIYFYYKSMIEGNGFKKFKNYPKRFIQLNF
jgi:hypothetical protein